MNKFKVRDRVESSDYPNSKGTLIYYDNYAYIKRDDGKKEVVNEVNLEFILNPLEK